MYLLAIYSSLLLVLLALWWILRYPVSMAALFVLTYPLPAAVLVIIDLGSDQIRTGKILSGLEEVVTQGFFYYSAWLTLAGPWIAVVGIVGSWGFGCVPLVRRLGAANRYWFVGGICTVWGLFFGGLGGSVEGLIFGVIICRYLKLDISTEIRSLNLNTA